VHGAPPDEPTIEPWQKVLGHITHWALYALLIIVPIIGWRAVSHYGPFEPFGFKLPTIGTQNDSAATQAFFYHMVAAYALIVLAGMHVGAGLFHYVIRKDGVLRRMFVRAGRLS
jgi:cytochrome b561